MTRSEQLFQEAVTRIPGGVNSPVRAFGSVGLTPRFIASAKGAYLTDADGNQYLDYIGSWGPMILGHATPLVLQKVEEACRKGLSFGAATEAEVDMARLICGMVPSVEMVRMVNSGTEAVMSAIRAARGCTGRDKIIKFEGCYHGHSDAMLVKAGSGVMTAGVPDSSGVPAGCTQDTLLAVYNDIPGVERLFEEFGSEIAAVIVEPVGANMGVVLPEEGFLETLRSLCTKHGSVRGDVAFAQSCLETGNFMFSGSAVTLEQNNFAGMGVTQNGRKGLSFDTAQLGIRCQIQHLKAYACTEALVNENIDPRFKYVVRGCAPYVEWLGIRENPQGKGWAAGAGYGEKILSILKEITGEAGSAGDGADSPDNPVQPMSGYVKVFYKGRDGVNVRTAPCMGDNVDQVVYEGIYTVTGISLDKRWYRLKSGLFITADAEYVMFMERLPGKSSYLVRVDIPDLNIRKGPGTDFARTGLFTGAGTFTIVEEADGKGAGKWGLLKSYKRERNGWISLDFVTRL